MPNRTSQPGPQSPLPALNVAVLMGGRSAEATVSRNSAAQVAAALEQNGHSATLVELDNQCADRLRQISPDVVFPALHGPPGEDGTVQGFLEILELRYVGSGVRGCALAMDKHIAKSIFRTAGLPVLDDVVIDADTVEQAQDIILRKVGQSVVIKPLNQGSAIGVQLLPNGGDIQTALRSALEYGACLVEPYLIGREITVGVLQKGADLVPHPVIEIRTAPDEWYDYHNRYAAGASEHIIPAELPQATLTSLQEMALRAHQSLGLRDLSRADFLVTDNNEIVLLEVNALPGMTSTSLYPDGARHLGLEFNQLIEFLCRQAAARSD